ncbi:hypothetical protein [Priestia megaterium]
MARSTTGLTTETVNRFLINAGALYINLGLPDERLLGATRDGVTMTIEQDVTEIEVDGSKGPFMGGRRILEVRPRLEATVLEMTPENLQLALAGSDTADYTEEGSTAPTHTAITRNRGIQLSDYVANIAVVGTLSGSGENFIGIIYNALQDDDFEIGTDPTGEAELGVTFTGHFDPANMDQEPWEIRLPNITTTTTSPTA